MITPLPRLFMLMLGLLWVWPLWVGAEEAASPGTVVVRDVLQIQAPVAPALPVETPASTLAPVTPPSAAPAASVTAAPTAPSTPPAAFFWHTVAPGERVFSLARLYKVNPQQLIALNQLTPPFSLE